MAQDQLKDPSLIQQVLYGLIAAANEVGKPGSGMATIEMLRRGHEMGRERQQGDALTNIALTGVELSRTPERLYLRGGAPEESAATQYNAGVPASDLVRQIQSKTLGASQNRSNPAFQEMFQTILDYAEKYRGLGGSPDTLLDVLGKVGAIKTASERNAEEVTRRTMDLQQQKEEAATAAATAKGDLQQKLLDKRIKSQEALAKLHNDLKISYDKIASGGKVSPGQTYSLWLREKGLWDTSLESMWEDERLDFMNQNGTIEGFPSFSKWKKTNAPQTPDYLQDTPESRQKFSSRIKDMLSGETTTKPNPNPNPDKNIDKTKFKTPQDIINARKSGELNTEEAKNLIEELFPGFAKAIRTGK